MSFSKTFLRSNTETKEMADKPTAGYMVGLVG